MNHFVNNKNLIFEEKNANKPRKIEILTIIINVNFSSANIATSLPDKIEYLSKLRRSIISY